METRFTNDQSEVSAIFEIKKDDAPLLSSVATVNGDYSVSSLDNNVIEYWAYDADWNDIKMYPYEDVDTYESWEWNESLDDWEIVEVTETYIEPMFKLKFGDGSIVDIGAYYGADSDWGFIELQQVITFIMEDL